MNENTKSKATIIALEKQALALWNNGNPDGFIEISADPLWRKHLLHKSTIKQWIQEEKGWKL